MNSGEDKLYTKLVTFDEIYNFVVQTFFIWSHLVAQKIDILSTSGYRKPGLDNISIFWETGSLQMKKVWTTKL
jgi:hypothetical protein